ncbi:MAG: hypothetical protein DMF63_14765 [Acidobacteria bacterium]|nr:MAG: hypothetical protein DMF63_14765 [Acidobacteriota bacterium]
MRFLYLSLFVLMVLFGVSCTGEKKPDTPLESFKAYVTAVKQKDTTRMKLLLSSDSIKMHEQEAKAQNVTLDDVVRRETLFTEGQKTVEFRNQKIEGEKATLEVKNSFGTWETVPFVREEDEWKIDKKGYADRMLQDVEQNSQQMDDFINQGKEPQP